MGDELVGAVLDAGDNEQAAHRPHRRPLAGPPGSFRKTVLDVLSIPILPAAGGTCVSLPERPAAGVPAPPALDGTDEHVSVMNTFGISCTAGAIGSCIFHAG
jgi:hypothetical protein